MAEIWKKYKMAALLCIIGVVFLFLKFIVPLVAPVLTAMLFVTICGPFLQQAQRRLHVHRKVGAVFLLLFIGTVLFIAAWLLLTWVLNSLPGWIGNMEEAGKWLEDVTGQLCNLGSRFVGIDNAYLEDMVSTYLQKGTDYLQRELVPGVLSGSVKYAKDLVAAAGFLLLFVIASVFLAKDYDDIMNRLLNRQDCHVLLEIICGIIRYIATFVKAQLVIMLLIGSLCATVLYLDGIPGGFFWGILAGILDALPFFGTGIVLVPLALTQAVGGSYVRALVCLLLYVGCIIIRELLEPRLIGKGMGIPPLAVLTAVYAGVQLFGITGIIKGPLGFVLVYQTYLSLQKKLTL